LLFKKLRRHGHFLPLPRKAIEKLCRGWFERCDPDASGELSFADIGN